MRDPSVGRRDALDDAPALESLLENVRLFAKRHRSCGRLWIDVPPASYRETTRRIAAACLCGDTLDEVVALSAVSGSQLGRLIETLPIREQPPAA
jgi:hypothetical protein